MKRRGFTLVEVMLVMLIMAILAAAMLLSMSGGEDNAQATAILNDLRIMKSGAYLFVTESNDFMPSTGVNYAELLGKYMDNGRIINDPPRYAFLVDIYEDKWWVGVGLKGNEKVGRLLEDKAPKLLLYGSDNISTPPPDFSPASAFKKSNKAVWAKAK